MHGQISEGQIKKIISSTNEHESITIRLSIDNFPGKHKVPLKRTKINQLNIANTGMNLTLSFSQINNVNDIVLSIQKKYGSVIPFLALIPIIASVLGAAGGVAGGVVQYIQLIHWSENIILLMDEYCF